MATTTVRLDPEEEQMLDHLALVHGGRSNALRKGLKLLVAETLRSEALAEFVREWEFESNPVTTEEVDAAVARYGL
jgi:predicted transcriptional regulator